MKSKKAFSLIEIVIATGILSVTVFWIYKLIWENNKIITNSNIYLTQNQTFENARQCLKWVKNLPWNYLDFWEDLKSCNFLLSLVYLHYLKKSPRATTLRDFVVNCTTINWLSRIYYT